MVPLRNIVLASALAVICHDGAFALERAGKEREDAGALLPAVNGRCRLLLSNNYFSEWPKCPEAAVELLPAAPDRSRGGVTILHLASTDGVVLSRADAWALERLGLRVHEWLEFANKSYQERIARRLSVGRKPETLARPEPERATVEPSQADQAVDMSENPPETSESAADAAQRQSLESEWDVEPDTAPVGAAETAAQPPSVELPARPADPASGSRAGAAEAARTVKPALAPEQRPAVERAASPEQLKESTPGPVPSTRPGALAENTPAREEPPPGPGRAGQPSAPAELVKEAEQSASDALDTAKLKLAEEGQAAEARDRERARETAGRSVERRRVKKTARRLAAKADRKRSTRRTASAPGGRRGNRVAGGRTPRGSIRPTAAQAKSGGSSYHVVRRGDSLWRIAKRRYGAGSRYPLVWNANRSILKHPDLIYPGQRLVLPPRNA